MRALAVLAALAALLAEVALVGFLLDLPRLGINQGEGLGGAAAWAINLGLLAAFGLSHSVMARPAFKRWWTERIPPALERSVYLAVSALMLGLLILAWQPLPTLLWQVGDGAAVALRLLFLLGLATLLWAVMSLDPLGFHGLRQVFSPGSGDPPFSMRGPYRWVRHPIQTGLILMLWATPALSVGQTMLAAVLTAYSLIATLRLEERDLVAAIGAPYRDYQRRVPALIPFWRR
jgi:protein-S-isoprenylcysteine O-methyltransferase Ste14